MENNRGMKYGIYEGVAASGMSGITSVYLTVFALAMGINNFGIGLIVAIPAVFNMIAYLPAAYFVEGSGSRNRLCSIMALLARGSWFLVAIVPAFVDFRFFWLLGFVCASSLFESFVGPAWASMIGDMVPQAHRGSYFGRRNMYCKIASLGATFTAGFVLDFVVGLNGFMIIFAAAGVFGVMTSFFFSQFSEPRGGIGSKVRVVSEIKDATKNSMFKRFVIISCIWQFGVSMASPFFNVYIVDTLGAAYHWISILTLVSGVSAILVQRGVGNMADKFGQRSILIIGALGASLIPLMYVFTTAPEHVIPINIISGISWAAVDLAAFNYLLETTRGKERAMYSAIYWSMTDIPIIFGPIVGGAIVDALPMGIFSFSGYTFMFFVSWLVRLSGALLFMKFLLELPERKVYSTRYVTGELMIVGFSGMWRSFHLIKETGSIPSRIVNGVEMFVRRSIRAVS